MTDSIFKTLASAGLILTATSLHAATIDEIYLKGFGNNISTTKTSSLTLGVDDQERAHCGTPLKKVLRRDWDKLQPATQKILAKQLALTALSGEVSVISSNGHFNIHYASSGIDAPPSADFNLNKIPDWVETVASTFEDVYNYYQNQGYRIPATTSNRYDIYLRDLAPQSLYGQTTGSKAAPAPGYPNAFDSYMEIDNNFTDIKFVNANGGPYSPTSSLQITAAHEFHHAIQYAYNYYFDIWYGEATSTWYEDEQYDGVNQLYNYLPAWFGNSDLSLDIPVESNALTNGAGYSRWLFNRYLAERFGTPVVREAWQNLASYNTPAGGNDIPMTPVLQATLANPYSSDLGSEFFGFAKSVYLQDWTSHTGEISKIHTEVPLATYSSYPVNNSVTLPHYSFAYYKFIPSQSVPNLAITTNKTSGISTAMFLNRNGLVSEIAPNNGSYTVSGFSGMNPNTDEVALLVVNTTSVDNHSISFSSDGNVSSVTPPSPTNSSSSTGSTSPTGTSSSGGSSSGCFIATAAYGSYLHPQVQVLRDFRDNYLLTNPIGRAFVEFYYRTSPPIADYIALHPFLRLLVRLLLTPIVAVVAHPFITFIALLLFFGTVIKLRRNQIKYILTRKIA